MTLYAQVGRNATLATDFLPLSSYKRSLVLRTLLFYKNSCNILSKAVLKIKKTIFNMIYIT